MKICVVRHGETDWNRDRIMQGREDIPLNVRGLAQAARVGDYLKAAPHDWRRVLTSPLSRASRTAECIAQSLGGIGVHIDRVWIERDYGEGSGLSLEQRRARFPDGEYEGMEPFEALQKRAGDAIGECAARYADENIIVVSHGGFIRAMLAALTEPESGLAKIRLKNAGITMLNNESGHLTIDFHNMTADELLGGG